ncbi:MAG TPA: TrbC/VirB2 family protein [Clostridiaceae bacterium]|jgi:type IV secretory pathway VirB2 component (pilin)|nr:TrbC/VirB2 family protein [Clostridiaceae bacterium]
MKKTLKVIFIIAVMLFGLLGVSQNISFAEKADVGGTLDNVNSATGGDIGDAATIGGNIVNWIWGISIVVAVVVVMITGLKFIVGSTQEKAEYKKSLIPLVVGVLILVFATTIVKVLFGMGGK